MKLFITGIVLFCFLFGQTFVESYGKNDYPLGISSLLELKSDEYCKSLSILLPMKLSLRHPSRRHLSKCSLIFIHCLLVTQMSDIELNPGPCPSSIVIHHNVQGTFHQGSDMFSDNSRGRQCVANAYISCVYKHVSGKSFIEWNAPDIDSLLHKGDALYKYTRSFFNAVYLEPCELPSFVCLDGQIVKCSVIATYSGDIGTSFQTTGDFYSLEIALTLCLSAIPHAGIIISNNIAMSVHYSEPYFHVFDSHARNRFGSSCDNGAASIFSVKTLAELQALLRHIFGSNEHDAFDLHKIEMKTIIKKQTFRLAEVSNKICLSTHAFNRTLLCVCCSSACKTKKTLYEKFYASVQFGPNYVCKCCSQTWFKESVRNVKGISQNMCKKCDLAQNDWVCYTCFKYLKSDKIPPCSKMNGMLFPIKPKELHLSPLEERLVAPRIPFMQLREKPRGGQLSITGNVVNVPADVTSTVKILPRLISEDETIGLKFKRRLSFKHHVAFERIRPNKVIAAANWLVENSALFRNEGIEVNHNWLNEQHNVDSDEETSGQENLNNAAANVESFPTRSDIDNSANVTECWTEDPHIEDRPAGNMDTVLQCIDFREFNEVLSVAPGENNIPMGIYQDKNAEFLSFPTVYCGETRPDNNSRTVPIHYSDICKWEMRNVDRRAATCIPNLFFKMKKLQIKQIQDQVLLAVRKCKLKDKKYTVAEILNPQISDSIVRHNDGYRVLRTLRGSPPYWEACKKDIFAMIRQLGLPTWFCSFSAAETKWLPLLVALGKFVDNKDYSEEEVANLTWDQKSRLIKSDPVTCARYFDYRFQRFMFEVLMDKSRPIGEIVDYFYRIEFQQRGSPHVHMLVWIKNAPSTKSHSNIDVTGFVDKYLTCSKTAAEDYLVNYQTHRHARSCMKKNKPVCRFNFPIPPMPSTVILSPIEDAESGSAQKHYEKISNFINLPEMKETEMSFDEFLFKLGIDFDTYKQAIRSSLKQEKIFLRRKPCETRINLYNPTLLKCWLANMDIQFVLDPYACAAYIVSYISKGQRGMSNLLHKACEEALAEESDIRQQVRRIGNQFLTHVEVGAQEAAYLVLQMPLRRTSRKVLFVNTTPLEDRVVMIKPKHVLEDMTEESTDIESGNIVTLYQQRPKDIDRVCLADFVSQFSVKYQSKQKKAKLLADGELPELEYEENVSDFQPQETENTDLAQTYTFKNGTVITKRKKPCVLRWPNFDKETDSEKHYREQLMLFCPWRSEIDLLHKCDTFKDSYLLYKNDIEKKQAEYEKGAYATNSIENILLCGEDNLCTDQVAPGNEHLEQIDQEEGLSLSMQYGCFDPGKDAPVYDVGLDIGITRKQIGHEELSQWGEMKDVEYRQMVRQLNWQQKDFFYHVLHWMKTKTEPLYVFLTGGAGVGKSVVTRSLYQALIKFFSHQLHANPDTLHVLLCAPTGKAAHNIKGKTIHSTFCLPIGQGFSYKPLDMQQLNNMRTKYIDLKIIFIDEISMVGRGMFNFINLRLQEIKGSKIPFGGVSIVAVGDLYQLKPVMDGWIFTQSKTDYGPIATNLWQDKFQMYELTEVMRQKDDQDFARLLNRLREGEQTVNDIAILKSRVAHESPLLTSIPHLFTTRLAVQEYNDNIYDAANCLRKVLICAVDWVLGAMENDVKEKVLARTPKDSSHTMGLSKELKLVINIPTEITNNVNVEDGITNGSACVVKKFDYRVHGSERVSIVWVEFDDKHSGQKQRTEYSHLYSTDIDRNWTPILEITRVFTIKFHGTFYIKRRQFPLQLAAARTIHKAQGSTLTSAVIHFGFRKSDHMHYVGLSRVISMQNVHILHLSEEKIAISSSVADEMKRLRSDGNITFCVDKIALYPRSVTKLVFFNIRSLHCHIHDLQKDDNILSADFLAISETRLMQLDEDGQYELPGFSIVRHDFEQQNMERPAYGLLLYVKNSVLFRNVNKLCFGQIQFLSVEIACSHQWIRVIFFYMQPKVTLHIAQDVLRQVLNDSDCSKPTLVAADTNFDLNLTNTLKNFMLEEYGLQYLPTKCTTDYGSTLDQSFTNLTLDEIFKVGTLESYYSDHKPLFVALK